jgi:hypothetical protein
MKWLLRPSLLIVASTAFVVGAVAVALRTGPTLTRPAPLPVADGDAEVVWLYAATNPAAWERFVAAVRHAPEALRKDHPDVRAEVDPAAAFPQQTTAVPEVALSFGPGQGRLVFRWYKLTSDWSTRDWVEALLKRAPPPLAVIGGSSSDGARDLAWQFQQAGDALPESARPLLLLTTATADRVVAPGTENGAQPAPVPAPAGEEVEVTPGVNLNDLYKGRTFRFCFTNRQMAGAVTNFLWGQPDLRPDRDPVYMVRWDDDSYSRDLIEGFWNALKRLEERGQFTMTIPPTPQVIDSSVGGFSRPNGFEAKVARDLLDLRQAERARPERPQKRPLLVMTGQSAPSRRFLRALARSAPDMAREFVVATGDAIAFNNVYRDRAVAWNVQDLPLPLVFFCHRNPIDPGAGFRPLPRDRGGAPPSGSDLTAATGTEDILLYGDIVEALAQAQRRGGRPAADAAELAAGLAELHVNAGHIGFGTAGTPLFNPDNFGRRRWGTGEHIVCLRPHVQAGRVLPEATVSVWAWHGRADQKYYEGEWRPAGAPLKVPYDQAPVEGGGHE